MEKSLKSSVWRYFKICKDDERKADCLVCESNAAFSAKQIIRGKSSRSFSTKPLWNHLEWKHPEFHKEAKTPFEKSCEEEDPLNVPTTPNATGRKETPNLQNVARKQTMWSLDDRRSMDISKVICELMALDAEPFSLVEREGFTRLIRSLAPQYPLPNGAYFSKNVMPRVDEAFRGKIKEILSTASFISFTTDIWTEKANNESFISLTGHCLSPENMRREVFTLQAKHSTNSTAHDISEVLSDAMAEWEIPNEKIYLVLRDDAANVNPGTNLMVGESVGCFINALKLVVEDAPFMHRSVVAEISQKCREVLSHCSHSSFACFESGLKQLNHELMQDDSSSWNPTFSMLSRLREHRQALIAHAAEYEIPTLTTNQWNMVERVSRVLEPFEEMIRQATADHQTIGYVIPAVATMSSYLSKRPKDPDTLTMKQELRECLHNRFLNPSGLNVQNSRCFVLATLLDPRYKSRFLQDVEIAREWLIAELCSASRGNIARNMDAESLSSDAQEDVWKYFDDIACISKSEREESIDCDYNPEDNDQSAFGFGLHSSNGGRKEAAGYNEELERYLTQPLLARQEDPFTWWRQHSADYPMLKRLALKYLSAPASSLNSKRDFSAAEKVYRENRNRLPTGSAKMLLFVMKNIKMLESSGVM